MFGMKGIMKPAVLDTDGLKVIGSIPVVDGFGFAAVGEVIEQNKWQEIKLFPAN